jgi:antitoxin PrlF
MKSTLKITSKGQVTLRKAVMDQLGVRPGDRITVEFIAPGRVEVRPVKAGSSLEAFVGSLKKPGAPSLSIEEMNAIASEGWAGQQ